MPRRLPSRRAKSASRYGGLSDSSVDDSTAYESDGSVDMPSPARVNVTTAPPPDVTPAPAPPVGEQAESGAVTPARTDDAMSPPLARRGEGWPLSPSISEPSQASYDQSVIESAINVCDHAHDLTVDDLAKQYTYAPPSTRKAPPPKEFKTPGHAHFTRYNEKVYAVLEPDATPPFMRGTRHRPHKPGVHHHHDHLQHQHAHQDRRRSASADVARATLLQRLEDEEMRDVEDDAEAERPRVALADDDEGMSSADSEDPEHDDDDGVGSNVPESIGFDESISQVGIGGVQTRRSARIAAQPPSVVSAESARASSAPGSSGVGGDDDQYEADSEAGNEDVGDEHGGVIGTVFAGLGSLLRGTADRIIYTATLIVTGAWGIGMSLYALLLSLIFADLWFGTAVGSVARRPFVGKERSSTRRAVELQSPHLSPSLQSPRSVPASPVSTTASSRLMYASTASSPVAMPDSDFDVPIPSVKQQGKSVLFWSLVIAAVVAGAVVVMQQPQVLEATIHMSSQIADQAWLTSELVAKLVRNAASGLGNSLGRGVGGGSSTVDKLPPTVDTAAITAAIDAAVSKAVASSLKQLEQVGSKLDAASSDVASLHSAVQQQDSRLAQIVSQLGGAEANAGRALTEAERAATVASNAQAAAAAVAEAAKTAQSVQQADKADSGAASAAITAATSRVDALEQQVLQTSNGLNSIMQDVRALMDGAAAAAAASPSATAGDDAKLAELQAKLAEIEQSVSLRVTESMANVKDLVRDAVAQLQPASPSAKTVELSSDDLTTLTEQVVARVQQVNVLDNVRREIQSALDVFAADRINRADFAVGAAGARVLSARTSSTYRRSSTTDLLSDPIGVLLGAPSPASVVLEPDMTPGKCWAFAGSTGRLTVRLSEPVIVTGVSIDHVPAGVAHDIRSAPQRFTATAYPTERSVDGRELGSWAYSIDDGAPSVQTFDLAPSEVAKDASEVVQFDFHDNHGLSKYTCVYRVRVHGTPVIVL